MMYHAEEESIIYFIFDSNNQNKYRILYAQY